MTARLIAALILYPLGFVLLFGAWEVLLYFPPPRGAEALENWIVATLGALTGPHLHADQPGEEIMKKTAIALAALALAGCASLDNAGYSGIEVKQSASGKGCDLAMRDGKEFAGRNIAFDGDGCSLMVSEGEVKAFKGQGIAAKAATVLPVTNLDEILGTKP